MRSCDLSTFMERSTLPKQAVAAVYGYLTQELLSMAVKASTKAVTQPQPKDSILEEEVVKRRDAGA